MHVIQALCWRLYPVYNFIFLSSFSVLYNFLIVVNIVSGISYQTDDHSLRDEFAKYGQVIEGIMPIAALALALLSADQLCFNLSS
jgi:hypothetical protein